MIFCLALSQAFQMFFSTEVMAQLKWEAFASGATNTVTVASNNAVRIHAILPGQGAGTNTGILVEFGTNAPVFLSGSQYDVEVWGDRVAFGGSQTYATTTLNSVTPRGLLLLPGPLTIRKSSDAVSVVLVYESLSSAALTSATPTQGSSVVIPTTATGDVDVKLEQSADNITWTECLPGTYNSSTVKRFFRVRAVEK
ncbi:MAG: hypothetical protein EBS53_11095 [Bacteroidetes bacterium]|nr:hypothetical protein [Bacteroidota bacterium]